METTINKGVLERVRIKLQFDNYFTVNSVDESRGLAKLWLNKCEMEILNFSQSHIHAKL